MWPRAISGLILIASFGAGGLLHAGDTARELRVGGTVTLDARVTPAVSTATSRPGDPLILQIKIARPPEPANAQLNLEVSIPDPNSPASNSKRIPVGNLSFFGFPAGQTATFSVLVPPEAMELVRKGTLPLELRLVNQGREELASGARIDVLEALVRPPAP